MLHKNNASIFVSNKTCFIWGNATMFKWSVWITETFITKQANDELFSVFNDYNTYHQIACIFNNGKLVGNNIPQFKISRFLRCKEQKKLTQKDFKVFISNEVPRQQLKRFKITSIKFREMPTPGGPFKPSSLVQTTSLNKLMF